MYSRVGLEDLDSRYLVEQPFPDLHILWNQPILGYFSPESLEDPALKLAGLSFLYSIKALKEDKPYLALFSGGRT
ncbi:MAG: hypothetical protein QXW41_00290 [Fervidicoccaceae archaeon]